MTDRRKSPPLFDLMRERERAANAPDPISPSQKERPSEQVSSPERNPSAPAPARPTAWDSTGGVSRAERSAAAMLDEAPQTDKTLKLPMSMAYLIVALMLAGLVGAWVGGYKLGEKSGKAQMEALVKDEPVVRPRVDDDDPVSEPVTRQPAISTPPLPVEDPILNDRIDPGAPGLAVMSASGFLADDPREEGTNYLELATLPRDEASSAIEYMNSHGVPVIGIPRLDSRRSDANNPSRYTLYSLGVAAPGDQFRTMTRERDDHQRLIARLGKQWQQEFRGGSDFAVSKTQWVKYTP